MPARAKLSKVVKNTNQTRASTRSASLEDNRPSSVIDNNNSFPKKHVRTSFKDIDKDIVEVMVTMESSFNVEQRKVAPLLRMS